ncbi:VUT family protein [Francisella sp. SYW-9]|uniref:VUT family protein n=1 Tax=Francisella sp. SYW-9 TaxID=2610888 RepID=UPI00123DFEEA|nr:VUT family protein [Francisella sp. SYW-9]
MARRYTHYLYLTNNGAIFGILLAVFIALDMISGVASSKIVFINNYIQFPASVMIATLMYPILDIIAELFGRKPYVITISMRCFCDLLFVILALFIIQLPYPKDWSHQADFRYILGFIPIVAIMGIFIMIVANIINYIVLITLKNLLKSKFFVFRSFVSSSIAILVNSVLLVTLIYLNRFGLLKAFKYALNKASKCPRNYRQT